MSVDGSQGTQSNTHPTCCAVGLKPIEQYQDPKLRFQILSRKSLFLRSRAGKEIEVEDSPDLLKPR